ncbi:hypothetical protein BN7_234 [Wickerhamomyces ciferrii]|uniref:Peptidase S8/S53 domain-containing protein n=1 Tax=Wickerhamomyces ciferrii (strain ATCC 14091 / BCRC 22168 / CBS 111 / JCM 3599 / NBRC 0793 / NRRL Y-1031 F-60-10) TaxID=1206466 RepID=K0K770_WICCF|nr:uncharacterized protein BN7_234 [Wickerhamomyces ciferrii]CCH40700.1 hypothetical protein BN7_234 [Wickerhamomyces ciferrii]
MFDVNTKDKSPDDFFAESIASLLNIEKKEDNTVEIGKFKAIITDIQDDLLSQLIDNPSVINIFPDVDVKLFDNDHQYPKGVIRKSLESTDSFSKFVKRDDITVQQNAPRHLSRLSKREGIWDQSGPYEDQYDSTGEGVTAYVLDTGIATTNRDFEGRAKFGVSYVLFGIPGDFNGHGTHVAGIIGSKTYGVAKKVDIVDVKILGALGSGSLSSIIRGIEWANNDRKKKNVKAVANLSLGSSFNNALNQAVDAAVDDGLVIVVAAGNENQNVSGTSPASSSKAITVGALDDRSDTIALFSNWGPSVDIFAPGVAVTSLSNSIFGGTNTFSGTSQASPVVAGLVAILLGKGIEVADIKNELIRLSTKNAISAPTFENNDDYSDTVNRVAYNGVVDSPDTIENPSTAEPDESLRPRTGWPFQSSFNGA